MDYGKVVFHIDEILKAQKEYFLTGATLPVEFRKENLKKYLKKK